MGQVQVEWTKVPRKMCARDGIRAAHMAAAQHREGLAGRAGRTGRRRDWGSLRLRALRSGHWLPGRAAPASPGDRLPPAGRAQGPAPCRLNANRMFLPRVGFRAPLGCGFSSHLCVSLRCVNSLSYQNQPLYLSVTGTR